MRAAAAVLALVLALPACSDVPPFDCDADEQCEADGVTGVCTFYGLCAFPNADCEVFELRYDDSAGDLAGVCVGEERFDPDCEMSTVEMPTDSACLPATRSCIDGCGSEACYNGCIDEDDDPEGCGTCIDDAYVACGNQNGCQVAWDTLECCYDDCVDPESDTCADQCEAEIFTYDTCLDILDDLCGEAADVCFP